MDLGTGVLSYTSMDMEGSAMLASTFNTYFLFILGGIACDAHYYFTHRRGFGAQSSDDYTGLIFCGG